MDSLLSAAHAVDQAQDDLDLADLLWTQAPGNERLARAYEARSRLYVGAMRHLGDEVRKFWVRWEVRDAVGGEREQGTGDRGQGE